MSKPLNALSRKFLEVLISCVRDPIRDDLRELFLERFLKPLFLRIHFSFLQLSPHRLQYIAVRVRRK